jgi:hypothetical protein
MTTSYSFALGGLAGNNAHGAGFLEAALNAKDRSGKYLEPKMISCTSGQLFWVSRYLQIILKRRNHPHAVHSIRHEFENAAAASMFPDWDFLKLVWFGKPGVFKPVWPLLYEADMLHNFAQSAADAMSAWPAVTPLNAWAQCFPIRFLTREFSQHDFEEIATVLRDSPVGVFFNSYNPRAGVEHVYLNGAAREFLKSSSSTPHVYDAGGHTPYREGRVYQDIDANAVRDALSIYEYGFDDNVTDFLDGAYFRDVMLSEVASAGLIFSVRPISRRWQGRLPTSWVDLQDMRTEVFFNGAYAAERNQILMVDKLRKDHALSAAAAKRYRKIDLVEIEIEVQRGFFDYTRESMDVFDAAEKQATARFQEKFSKEKPHAAVARQRPRVGALSVAA